MNFKLSILLGVFLLLSTAKLFAQGNLKELRERPETNIVNTDTASIIRIKQISVPIPQLGLKVNYWKHWTKFGINANQATFSDSWNSGGVNSHALSGIVWQKSEYTKDRFNFVTELDLKYGKVWNQDQLPKKNNDRIFWDNKIAHKLDDKWAIYFSFTFESQFDAGYKYKRDSVGQEIIDYKASSFMAPGYFTESLGLEYKLDKTLSVRLGTGTARQTFLLDTTVQQRYGVDPGKKFKNDLAFQITANLDRDLAKNLNLKARYNLFADYKMVSNPTQRLDVTLAAKITRLVQVTASGVVFYDPEQQNGKVQMSESLAMGIIFAFPK